MASPDFSGGAEFILHTMTHEENILILDFGSQYTQLIARRIREQDIYSEIFPHTLELDKIKELKPAGIILSGGPMSVYDEGAPSVDPAVFDLGIPVLGICYGMQLICYIRGGNVGEGAPPSSEMKPELAISIERNDHLPEAKGIHSSFADFENERRFLHSSP